ncbi:MAG: MFS transporter [Bacteroidales bacterium]|nr:MFS transporter [Bacteroidales bacterium]
MWGFWLYAGVAYGVFNMYLKVPALWVGVALFAIRIIDAMVDPLIGWISDNLRTKLGRRRPFILFAGVIAGLGLPALFLVSPAWVDVKFLGISVVFWYMIGSSIIYIPIMSAFSIPWNSLGPELSPDYDERTSIMTYRSVMQKFFEIGNFYALKFTNLAWFLYTDPLSGEVTKNTLQGIQVYTSILGAIMAILAVVIFFNVKERNYDKLVKTSKKRISLKSSFGETLRCRPFRMMLGVGAAFTVGTSMVGTLGYFTTVYYVSGGDKVGGDNWNFWVGMGMMIGGVMGAPILKMVADRIGKRPSLTITAVFGMIAFGTSWWLYNPDLPFLQVLSSGLMGFTNSALWMLHSSIGADIIDYDELQTGVRREGSFSACSSYILKLGNSTGGLIAGIILPLAKFNPDVAMQSGNTLFWIRFSLAILPIAGLGLAIYFVNKMELTKSMCSSIRTELEERRGTV